jgi:hypothetical protein
MLYLRGALQPLSERLALRDTTRLAESMRLADQANASGSHDALLGVAAKALE